MILEQFKKLSPSQQLEYYSAIKKEKDALQETLYKLAAKVYENTNTTNETSEEEVKESPKDDSVKDAEFEEK